MITTIAEFKAINEMQNTDIAPAIWDFYKPEGRAQFLGIESKLNHELADKAWHELSDEVQSMVSDWIRGNPWVYTALYNQTEWQEYMNSYR